MMITPDGCFIFDSVAEVQQANRLIRAIHKDGYVNSNDEFWVRWLQSEMAQKCTSNHNVILVWTTVFLPRLMWSVLCHVQGVDL
jgi:hypothetical protein